MPSDKPFAASLAMPLLMMLLAATAVLLLWSALRQDNESRVGDIVEAVSYASRSELARQLITQFRAIDRVRDFWTEYADSPVSQWRADAMIEIDHFAGLEAIAWAERDGARFFSSGPRLALDHVPDDEEWSLIEDSLEAAFEAESDAVAGPFIDDDGHAILSLYRPASDSSREAVMIAIVDVTDQVAALLEDDSPGYDIRVSCCDGVTLFSDGDFAAELPPNWQHGGLIEPLDDVLWRVQHQPSAVLASDFRPWALNTVLIVGMALALAIGAIAYHSRRADDRARAAKVAEQEVRTLNLGLEQRVDQRTRDLNEALADLNTISLSVAHDVRSPLNAASINVESILAVNDSNEKLTEQLNRVKSGLDRIDLILDRLLDLSSVSSFEAKKQELDLEALARRVGDELISEDEAEFTVGSLPPASVDPTMAHILLTNLISNALRHSAPRGRPRIEVGAREDESGIVYFVRDHGPGIDAAAKKDLFKPGRHSSAATSESGGLGLGLAIAARAMARHQGSIWAEDTEGGGATICFRFPVEEEERDTGDAAQRSRQAAPAARASGNRAE